MIKLYPEKTYLVHGIPLTDGTTLAQANAAAGETVAAEALSPQARDGTIAWSILSGHSARNTDDRVAVRFDALASHDITYVGIIQTALASGLDHFPVPYALTNCHNSLCAVGGTINEDDHAFGLSAARRFGGIFVPAHIAVIHQYVRETMAACGAMILGSDSHTRYGALGTMGVGEGGPELVKQLLGRTWDIPRPEVVGVYLTGRPSPGVGPQDVALAIIGGVFDSGFVKNKVVEFIGPGIANLSVDYRNGIDVMTTETACLSSIWQTDERVAEYYDAHGRPGSYRPLEPAAVTCYDGFITVDLSRIEPMIALPFHPSHAHPIREVIDHAERFLGEVEDRTAKQFEGSGLTLRLRDKITREGIRVEQGVVAGCAGGLFENIALMSRMMEGGTVGGGEYTLSVYPASQPVMYELNRIGAVNTLLDAGAVVKTAFCGPCFGAGDVPRSGGLSVRHTTRNFPNREGSKPGEGQLSAVALMDARSIAATSLRGGILTPATELPIPATEQPYHFRTELYARRVYDGTGKPRSAEPLILGPNIRSWPEMPPLAENLLLRVAAVITDPVTTTDELIPSGDTSSYRSNPIRLAEFTLSRKDPGYVPRAKAVLAMEEKRRAGEPLTGTDIEEAFKKLDTEGSLARFLPSTALGSVIYAHRPGDGSAREQAASCQKVLGGWANIALEYATKRYRSNLINWGILPFTVAEAPGLAPGDWLYLPGIAALIADGAEEIAALHLTKSSARPIRLLLTGLTKDDRDILLRGCLMNYYRNEAESQKR
ncbi:MAG: hydratase [Clostridiales bacterium]|nr:hydratase [Clostridiales bacterium]